MQIRLENVWNNFLISPVEAKRYIDEINHPLVGWYFDIGNVLRYGWPEQAAYISIFKWMNSNKSIITKRSISSGFDNSFLSDDYKKDYSDTIKEHVSCLKH